jgi:CRISPR-associated protein Csm3
MHHLELNRARFGLALEPRGPILVKSGIQTPDPTRPQLEFVRSRHAELGDTVYLPGSTIKGVLRSHAERLLLGQGLSQVCTPVGRDGSRCVVRQQAPKAVSRAQCPVCRIFGSLSQAGRLQLGDAFPWPLEGADGERRQAKERANRTERRFQVGIDREIGSAQDSALFDLEVVVDGCFETVGQLRNFELWQLGLLAQLVADLDQGFCAVGAGKSRGLGQMSARLTWLELEMATPRERANPDECLGIAALLDAPERRELGMVLSAAEDRVTLPAGSQLRRTWRGFSLGSRLAGPDLAAFVERLAEKPLKVFADRRGVPQGASHGA